MKGLSLLRKNLAMSITARGLANFIAFISTIYLIRYLGQIRYGRFAVALAFVNFFSFLMGPGFRTIMLRDLGKNRDLLPTLMGNMLVLRFVLAVITLMVMTAVTVLMHFEKEVTLLIFVLFIWLFFTNLALQFRSLFYVFQDLKLESIFMLLEAIIRAAWIGLSIWFKLDLFTFTVGFALIPLVLLLSSALISYIKYNIKNLKVNVSDWPELISTGLIIGLVGLVSSLHLRVDIVMLSKLTGNDSLVGLYGAAFKLIEAPLFVFAIFSSVILPEFARHLTTDKLWVRRESLYFTKIFTAIFIPSALLLAYFSKPLILSVYGESFLQTHQYFRVLLPSLFFMYFNTLTGTILYASGKQNTVLKNSVYSLLLNIGANLIFIPMWGAYGAAFTTILSEAFLFYLNFAEAKRSLATEP
ncbi:MAG: hypothetical protein DRQ06_02890 [Candidatus Hydrothermota bacterium]|nr:MAG: hypothetical protein DRQ06_02890 [Candidatus Hydrothermae bacterium]